MKEKTIDEEIPVTKEALIIYKEGIKKELAQKEPVVNRLNLVLKKVNEILSKM